METHVLAKEQAQTHRTSVAIPLVDDVHAAGNAAEALQAGLGHAQTVVQHLVVVTLYITHIVDVELVIKEGAGEAVLHTTLRAVVQVEHGAVALGAINIAVHEGAIEYP